MTVNAGTRACVAAVALLLSGCGDAADDAGEAYRVDFGAAPDPGSYAGEVDFRVAGTLRAEGREIPIELLAGLAPEAGTRLGVNAFVDMRHLQQALPDLLTRPVEASCGLGLDLRFDGAEAQAAEVRARASVDARVYRCARRGTEQERRGIRFLTQTIDVEATLGTALVDDCIEFRLAELELEPKGLIGRLATLFGVTERARAAILARVGETLRENRICPDFPPGIALFDPRFSTLALREIGEGGMGAALAGSIDLSAEKLVELLKLADARGARPAFVSSPTSAGVGRAAFRIDHTIELRGADVDVGLGIRLAAQGADRIGIETLLDLQDLQARLPEIAAGEVLVDNCGGRVTLVSLEADGRGSDVIARGTLDVERFACERTGPGTWARGDLQSAEQVGVRAELSADLVDGCVVFRVIDLRRDPPGSFRRIDTGSGRMEAARALLLEAAGLILEETPFCPNLPEELAVLDPRFDRGAPQEIGTGGTGVALDGSIDVSPATLVELLRILQGRGLLPPPA